jgi:hypothetical protein
LRGNQEGFALLREPSLVNVFGLFDAAGRQMVVAQVRMVAFVQEAVETEKAL